MSFVTLSTVALLLLQSVTASPAPRYRHNSRVNRHRGHRSGIAPAAVASPVAAPSLDSTVTDSTTTTVVVVTTVVGQEGAAATPDGLVAAEVPAASPLLAAAKYGGQASPASGVSQPAATGVTTPSSGGVKRGAAYNTVSDVEPFQGKVSWAYNWNSNPGGAMPSGVTYYPILWGPNKVGNWESDVLSAVKNGADVLLSFNEPDHETQANLPDAAAAAQQHLDLVDSQLAKIKAVYPDKQIRIGSPAVTSDQSDPNKGLKYLQKFTDACKSIGCTIDIIVIHWYGRLADIQNFKDHVANAHNQYPDKPIWITEFGTVNESIENQAAFLDQAQPYLESLSYVEKYAYFYAADNYLLSGGSLNAAGNRYVS